MAPTVYLSELPTMRKPTIPCSRRRQRINNGAVAKQRRLELRRLETNGTSLTPPESPLWEPESPNDSCAPTTVSSSSLNVSARISTDVGEHWKVFLARRKGLLDIVVRTMALVRRNNILQERVNALRAETRDFIHSVLNNPENKCIQEKLDKREHVEVNVNEEEEEEEAEAEEEDVSSSTEDTIRRPSLPFTPDSSNSTMNDVTSTCDISEHDSEQSCDDES